MFGSAIGRLRILIGGDASDLDKVLATTSKRISAFGKSQVQALAATVGITSATALLTKLLHSSFETIDAQSKLGHRLKGTTEDIQTLASAADLAGVPVEGLAKSAFKLMQGLAEAARTASGPAYEALRRLGLSADALLKMDVAERLATISDRMEELGYSTAQQAEVLKAFGIRGQEMLSLFEGGGKSIRQARDDVKAFGVAVSQIDGVKVEQANDAWTTAMLLFKGIGNQVAVELAPLVKQLGDDFAAAGRESKGFGETIQAGVLAAVRAWGTFSSEIHQFRLDWDENVAHLLDGINKITAGFNSINLAKGLTGEIPQIEHSFGKLRERIGAPPSTEDWDRWFGLIKLKAEMNAADVAAARNKMLGGNGPKTDPLTEEERKQQEQKFLEFQRSLANEDAALGIHREQQLAKLAEFQAKQIGTAAEHAAARLAIEEKYQKDRADLIFAKLEEGVATEQEILLRKHERQLAAIAEFENNRTITENAAAELRRKYAQKIALDMATIQARQYSQLAGIVDTAMGHISQVIGDEGGAAFELMKGISIATALVKGYEAVLSAYAAGVAIGGPFALATGTAFAAVAAAGVAAQIASIAATKPGGGGGAAASSPIASGGGGGAAAAAGAADGGGGGGTQTLLVQGIDSAALFSGDAVRMLAGRLLEFQRDGGKVVLA